MKFKKTMNSSDLVSIIVPIYNVENFLSDCLNSIRVQTYNNLQVILVDDGSIDNSSLVAKAFVEKDARFVLYYKVNGGLSSARNLGLEKVKGEYICFIDSDDYISENFILDFVENLKKHNADVVVCARYNVTGNALTPFFNSDTISIWNGLESTKRMLQWNGLDGSVCDKMFKARFFYNLRFKDNMISEDLPITAKIFSQANKIVHIGKPSYYYRQRDGSITKQNFNKKKITILYSVKEVDIIVNQNFPSLSLISKKFILHHIHYLISIYFRSRKISKEDEESFKEVRREFFKLFYIYFFPNGRNIFKKIILFFVITTNTQLFFRKSYHFLIVKRS